MKAKASFIVNQKEINEAHKIGIEAPEAKYEYDDFYFDKSDISNAYRSSTGQIVISQYGQQWFLKYDHELWSVIKGYLNCR